MCTKVGSGRVTRRKEGEREAFLGPAISREMFLTLKRKMTFSGRSVSKLEKMHAYRIHTVLSVH